VPQPVDLFLIVGNMKIASSWLWRILFIANEPHSPFQYLSGCLCVAINLVYPVTIELDHTAIFADGRDVPLSPGMSVQADIRTGERRVIDYILSPLKEVTSQAAHER
jgi:multidrug efflux pump subunit AcrA (membrane-fusion protein)